MHRFVITELTCSDLQLRVSADGADGSERLQALTVLRDAIEGVASELQDALQDALQDTPPGTTGPTGPCLCRRNTRNSCLR